MIYVYTICVCTHTHLHTHPYLYIYMFFQIVFITISICYYRYIDMIYSITNPIVWYTQSNKKYATGGSWKSTRHGFGMFGISIFIPRHGRDGLTAWKLGLFCSVVFFLKISITYKWEMIVGPTYGWIGKCGKMRLVERLRLFHWWSQGLWIYKCAFDSWGPDTNSNSGIPFLLEGAEVLMREYDTWVYMMQSCVFIYTDLNTLNLQATDIWSPSREKN